MQVTAEDLIESEEVFGELGRLASSLPEGLLMNFVRLLSSKGCIVSLEFG